jgi:hypothetical protein
MANLLRTAKSASNWSEMDLHAYNITIVPQNKAQFFGTNDLPYPTEPSMLNFMTNESQETATDKKTKQLLQYLYMAIYPRAGEEAAVENFAAELLRALEYDDSDRIVFIRHGMPFVICMETLVAQTDVCVMDDEILLLLQEDKSTNAEPQVIAEAIAAFAMNNMTRKYLLNPSLQPRDSMTFPALTMQRTTPTFYKITVTSALSMAVQAGIYPETETRVLRYIPALPRRNSWQGMDLLPNRNEILRCLEAFKRFLGN